MVREDLIDGVVSFLQDPSVATAPLEQRIAFLRSKNLTQDEIDASLARAGQAPTASNPQSPPPPPPLQQRQPYPPYAQQYGYPQQWQQTPAGRPYRDWRDYFIGATVIGGVGYGLYWTAKRYIYPLLAPPTPPQLEQDKASVNASFDQAFALLDQLATDTQELKAAEAARKERLDAALVDVESVISRMKQVNEDRELEAKRIAREINEIRDQIPRAIEKEAKATDNRLMDLNAEMKSLKTLVANRMQAGSGATAGLRTTSNFPPPSQPALGFMSPAVQAAANSTSPAQTTTPSAQGRIQTTGSSGEANSTNSIATSAEPSDSLPFSLPGGSRGSAPTYSCGRLPKGIAQIPSWQLAAKKKTDEAKTDEAKTDEAKTDAVARASTPLQNGLVGGSAPEGDGQT